MKVSCDLPGVEYRAEILDFPLEPLDLSDEAIAISLVCGLGVRRGGKCQRDNAEPEKGPGTVPRFCRRKRSRHIAPPVEFTGVHVSFSTFCLPGIGVRLNQSTTTIVPTLLPAQPGV